MDRFELLRTELTRRCPGLELREEEPMARHTSFHIGGPARLMALPRTEEEARETLQAAWALEIPPFFLGNGSNLLVADRGYEGFVVKPAGALEEIRAPRNGRGEGAAGGGGAALLSRLSKAALDQGLTGLEFAQGIPGSVGGGVTMNAGAYGGETAQVLLQVTALERDGTQRLLSGADCGLSYRHSRFSDGGPADLPGGIRPAGGKPGGDRRADGRLCPAAEREAASGISQRRLHLQAPPGLFCRRPHRPVRPEGQGGGGAQVSEKHAGFLINRGAPPAPMSWSWRTRCGRRCCARPAWSWSWRSGCWGKMDGYTREELDEALTAVQSIIHKCEAARKKFRGAPPATPCWSGG